VEGRFLSPPSIEGLLAGATAARADRADVVFIAEGPLGDAIVLATALAVTIPEILVGVRINLTTEAHRHPALLGREMTTFDQVSGGRSVLAFIGPFSDATGEAIGLCRDMWRQGIAAGEGPHYPVAGAINRPGPCRDGGPPIALDLTDGASADASLLRLVDLVLIPAEGSAPPALPAGVDVCQIQDA
jgi:alkanesulfonate monooxygenase SsuD/methylene tetrahydromethanopterin reductase-like flavin-dependent oxidoreductase (luciferase family)